MNHKDLLKGDLVEFDNGSLFRGIILSIDYPFFYIGSWGNVYKVSKELIVNKLTPKQVEYNIERIDNTP